MSTVYLYEVENPGYYGSAYTTVVTLNKQLKGRNCKGNYRDELHLKCKLLRSCDKKDWCNEILEPLWLGIKTEGDFIFDSDLTNDLVKYLFENQEDLLVEEYSSIQEVEKMIDEAGFTSDLEKDGYIW